MACLNPIVSNYSPSMAALVLTFFMATFCSMNLTGVLTEAWLVNMEWCWCASLWYFVFGVCVLFELSFWGIYKLHRITTPFYKRFALTPIPHFYMTASFSFGVINTVPQSHEILIWHWFVTKTMPNIAVMPQSSIILIRWPALDQHNEYDPSFLVSHHCSMICGDKQKNLTRLRCSIIDQWLQ